MEDNFRCSIFYIQAAACKLEIFARKSCKLRILARKLGFNLGIRKTIISVPKQLLDMSQARPTIEGNIEHGREHTNNSLMNRKGDF